MNQKQKIGSNIKAAFKASGKSGRNITENHGLKFETMSVIENGDGNYRIDSLLKYCAAVGLEIRVVPKSPGTEN